MLHSLRFFGLLLVNAFVALIGTAIVETAIWKLFPTHTFATILWKEVILSVVFAAAIGFGMWRTWRSNPAKWTWTLTTLWFCVAGIALAGRGIWGPLSLNTTGGLGTAETRTFFAFTVPLIRGISYSLGALAGSFVYPKAVTDDKPASGVFL